MFIAKSKSEVGIQTVHRDVHVKSFHERLLFSLGFLGFDCGGQQRPSAVSTTVRHSFGIPWQQFCVR